MKSYKKMPKYLVGLLFCGLFLMLANGGFAQGRHGFRGPGFGKHHGGFGNIERLAGKLDLSENQVNTIKAERLKTQKQAIQLHADLQVARLELRDMMGDGKPDENKVKQQVEKMGELHTSLMLTRVQGRLKMKEILTEEQLGKLKEMRLEMRSRPDRKRGHSRMGRGGFGMLDEGDFLGPEEEMESDPF